MKQDNEKIFLEDPDTKLDLILKSIIKIFGVILLISWFLFYVIPSCTLLKDAGIADSKNIILDSIAKSNLEQLKPPQPKQNLDTINEATKINAIISAYEKEVEIYYKKIDYYKTLSDSLGKSQYTAAYKLIYEQNFFKILQALLVAILGYAGIKFTLTALTNIKLLKQNKEPLRYKLFD